MNYHNINTYTLYSQPYLDKLNQCYKNIVTINFLPKGPLGGFIRRIKLHPLSEFKQPGPCSNNRQQQCALGFVSLNPVCSKNGCGLMTVDEIPSFFSILLANGYKIDTSLTKMLNNSGITFHSENENKIIAIITYTGNQG
jgi:hypothetical protein